MQNSFDKLYGKWCDEGFVEFEAESEADGGSQSWLDWLTGAKKLCEELKVDHSAEAFYRNVDVRWDGSRNVAWRNKNGVVLGEIPSGLAKSFIDQLIEELDCKLWGPAQLSVLEPGYPSHDRPYGIRAYDYPIEALERGNLHVDGLDHEGNPLAFLVGVFVSKVEDSCFSGRPVHIGKSHHKVMEALRDQEDDEPNVSRAARLVKKKFQEDHGEKDFMHWKCTSGDPSKVIVYHGAVVHGMEPNYSERRDMVYFRFFFKDKKLKDVVSEEDNWGMKSTSP